jgi:hypothetical protein
MTELTQPTSRERTPNAGGLGGIFGDHHEPNGLVTVAVGPYVERLPLGNSSVAQIRARFGTRFDIDPRTQAVLDGHEVGDDIVVRTGQVLMFVHKSGEKGCRKIPVAQSCTLSVSPKTVASRDDFAERGSVSRSTLEFAIVPGSSRARSTSRSAAGRRPALLWLRLGRAVLYRGFATRKAPVEAGAQEHSKAPPIANRRYSRVQLCATSHPGHG